MHVTFYNQSAATPFTEKMEADIERLGENLLGGQHRLEDGADFDAKIITLTNLFQQAALTVVSPHSRVNIMTDPKSITVLIDRGVGPTGYAVIHADIWRNSRKKDAPIYFGTKLKAAA